jgi:adenine deaminase
MADQFFVEGTIADVVNGLLFKGGIVVSRGKIRKIYKKENVPDQLILPGLVDAHVHIESSMLVPSEFAKLAVVHGTVATVSDPHEIANVLGSEGVNFMIRNSKTVPFKFFFGAPSCVPATAFESSGAHLGPEDIDQLLGRTEIKYLSEMMNYPGVLSKDPEVQAKLLAAKKHHKPVDGHAPGLTGDQARQYIEAGISTDHECFTLEEALEKIKYGMKVQIREGSAAKNFDALIPLITHHRENIMLCSDDKHPDDLLEGHINLLIKKAIQLGYDPLSVIQVCTLNPVQHYNLEAGLLQEGDAADFILVNNFDDFNIKQVYINGTLVAKDGKCLFTTKMDAKPNLFKATPIVASDLNIKAFGQDIKVIRALEGQLITKTEIVKARIANNLIVSDPGQDILKMVVLNRYRESKPAKAFIRGFGLKSGALASTVAHDSHNIIAVGTSDEEISGAINLLIQSKGGIALVDGANQLHLPLPVAGIMTNQSGQEVAGLYNQLNNAAKKLGSKLHAPFMTLSFMALLVIPELKLSDQGLFDGQKFQFTSMFDI